MPRPRSVQASSCLPQRQDQGTLNPGVISVHPRGLLPVRTDCLPSMSEDVDGAVLSTFLSIQGPGRLL